MNVHTLHIYLDYAKAFDKVDNGIALEKLKSNGISDKMLFLRHFLKQEQCVCVFLVMIGYIDEGIENARLSSFSNDTSLLKHNAQLIDISLLQEDMNIVYHWTGQCNSQLN